MKQGCIISMFLYAGFHSAMRIVFKWLILSDGETVSSVGLTRAWHVNGGMMLRNSLHCKWSSGQPLWGSDSHWKNLKKYCFIHWSFLPNQIIWHYACIWISLCTLPWVTLTKPYCLFHVAFLFFVSTFFWCPNLSILLVIISRPLILYYSKDSFHQIICQR